jgi:hypothetical protein
MTVTLTRNGDRLYVGRSLAFLARRHYVNAWGRSNVEGVLFSLDTSDLQRNAVAFCNVPTSEAEIVEHAMKGAGD